MVKTQKLFIDRIRVLDSSIERSNESNVCPVCQYLARDVQDVLSIKEEQACTECVSNFKMIMKKEWLQGQRPTTEVARKRMNIFIEEV